MIPDKVLTFEDLRGPQGHGAETLDEFWHFVTRSRHHRLSPGAVGDSLVHPCIRTTFAVGAGWRARWLVCCPDCPGAEDASHEDPRFFCLSCYNGSVGGAIRPVLFPDDREEIERVVLARPARQVSTYEPGETLDDLKRQGELIELLVEEYGAKDIVPALKAALASGEGS